MSTLYKSADLAKFETAKDAGTPVQHQVKP